MLYLTLLIAFMETCLSGSSYATEYGINDLNVMKWKNHEEELQPNSPYLENLLANLVRNSPRDNEEAKKYQVSKDKKKYYNQMYPKVKCSSYNGKVICDIDKYNIAIKNSAQKFDVDTLERFTALIYHKLLKGDSTFQVGVNPQKKEVYAVHQDRASVDNNKEQRVYIECNPIRRSNSLQKDQEVYECKWQNLGYPKPEDDFQYKASPRYERSALGPPVTQRGFYSPVTSYRMKKMNHMVNRKRSPNKRDMCQPACPPPTPPCCPPKPPCNPTRATCPPPKVPCPPEPSLPCPKC